MIRALAFAAALGIPAPPLAHAHHTPSGVEYPAACCSNVDCHMVPPENVREVAGGYMVRTFRGDLFFPKSTQRQPLDGDWHECHNTRSAGRHLETINPLCIFPPFKGF